MTGAAGLLRAARAARRGFAVVALLAWGQASAGNILGRAGNGGPSQAPVPTAASQAAAAAAAQVGSLTRQADSPLRRALDAVQAFQSGQQAARAAASAAAAAAGVPDGLAGLVQLQAADGGVWTGADGPVETASGDRHDVTVKQTDARAVLTWKRFDVGALTNLTFDQSAGLADASSWVALNRVLDPGAAPSRILGAIKAPGQVYVLNQNGILFGGTAQVNVGSLLLSGLEISAGGATEADRLKAANDRFRSASLSGLSFDRGSAPAAGPITIEAGASLAADPGGRVVVLGGSVVNAGSLAAPDGQIFLAAGSRIQLAASGNLTQVRGLAPPVAAGSGAPGGSPVLEGDGPVVNAAGGVITARRGNVTMVGRETRQDGLITVTNGAEVVGSIDLGTAVGGFTTSFGKGSVTQILPDLDDKAVLGAGTTYQPSAIRVNGDRITVGEGATLYAPSGSIALVAAMAADRPAGATDPTLLDDTRIDVGAGARLDVSGLRGVEVAMESNSVKGELRANELRDNPLLRGGALHGRAVYFDARLGGKLKDGSGVADLSGYYDLLSRSVPQLMTSGGSITLDANQIVTRHGSVLDLSGGSAQVLGGYVRRTVLVDSTGKRTPIEEAITGVQYVGTEDDYVLASPRFGLTQTWSSPLTQARARYEAGYLQGAAAGALSIGTLQTSWSGQEATDTGNGDRPPVNPSASGAVRILDGQVLATTVVGAKQRATPTGTTDPAKLWSERPAGATLAITGAGDVTFAEQADRLPTGYTAGDAIDSALRYKTVLPLGWFRKDGTPTFSTVSIEAGYDPDIQKGTDFGSGTIDRAPGGHLTLGAGQVLDLGTGGSISFTGKAVSLEAGSTIVAPGGNVSLLALRKGSADPLERAVRLEAGARIDVAGRWNNEALAGPTTPLEALDGGSVKLTGATVSLAAGSYLDVSGGGRLDASGAKLTAGAGGAITLDTVATPQPTDLTNLPPANVAVTPRPSALQLAGTLEGHALGQGGSLTIRSTGAIELGGALDPSAGLFDAGFLGRGGFSSFTLVGERGVTVRGEVAPAVESYVLPGLAGSIPKGTRLADVASTAVLRDPGGLGKAMRLTLSTGGNQYATIAPAVEVLPGAAIRLQPGSTVSLLSTDAVLVEGAIAARGGAISLSSTAVNGQRGVTLASGAVLDVSGYQTQSLVSGTLVRGVAKGGSVTMAVAKATAPLTLAEGSLIDASGVSGVADLATGSADPLVGGRTTPVAVDGGAGTIALSAQAGLVAGELRLGPGGGSASTGLGGSLTVTALRVQVSQGLPAAAAATALQLVADRVDASRADDVTLDLGAATSSFEPTSAVLFDGDVRLSARRSLSLLAPVVGTVPGRGGAVTLDAGYVALVGGAASLPVVAGAVDLASTLTVKAGLVDVSRTVVLGCSGDAGTICASGGFSTARLDAGQGDLRLSDHDPAGRDATADATAASTNPGLASTGAIELQGGQVYAASRGHSGTQPSVLERPASHPGFLVQSDTGISVLPPAAAGAVPAVPLAFGERLTLRAPLIEQDGVLRAPAGELRLEARNLDGTAGTVALGSGSLTSISLAAPDGSAGLAPFGDVLSGGVFYGYHQAGQAPSLSVSVDGARVKVASGAMVDVSGGGDLLGYGFVPGTGGSRDVLAPVVSASGDWRAAPALGGTLAAPFAVLPSLGAAPAPIGPVPSLRDGRLHVGDQIHLQGVPGLPDGDYTLLPAHYALLPGGRLVLPLGGAFASAPATSVRPDGAVVAAGYRLAAGTAARDPGYGQYAVMGSRGFGAYSDLSLASFDDYATRLAAEGGVGVRTLNDGGSLALAASESLSLQGTGRFGAGRGGLLGALDVSAARIAVVGAAGAARYAGYLTLDPQALSDFGAGSLLLGGTRTASTSAAAPGTTLQVAASEVVVDTGGVALAAPEILLAAQQKVTVADGAVVRAEGAAAGDAGTLRMTGDGALARLSTGGRIALVRGGGAGDLAIGQATLVASGSVALDAAGVLGVAPGATLTTPQLDVGSNLVHLGAAPAGAGGTVLTTATIERLAATSDLLVRGRDAIWLDGGLALGSRSGGAAAAGLTLDTALLQGSGGATARLAASTLALRNSGSSTGAGTAGTGTLQLDVDSLALGPGQVAVGGFGQVGGRAGTIQALGSGGLSIAGSLGTASAPLATGRLSAATGASYDVAASGAVALGADPTIGGLPAASGLGGRLTLTGASLLLDTVVALPAGTFEAAATAGALGVGAHAAIDVTGRTIDLAGQPRSAAGGAIRLGATGDLSVASGATLDVSASAQGGDAGRIELAARQGLVSVAGALTGRSTAGLGGTFTVDADHLDGFPALNGALATGGFTEARAFRVRGAGQALRLAEGERIGAHDVTLRADAGEVVVAGAIGLPGDAAHGAGGRVELTGGTGLTIAGTASIEARAAASEGAGFTPGSGRVLLATGPAGAVTVGGAAIDASGGRDGGEIVVRAPRTGDGVAVGALDGRFTAATLLVQGEATYQTTTVDDAWLAAHPVQAEAAAWLAAAQARHPQGLGGFTLAPAIRLASDGALSVQGTLSLAGLDAAGARISGGPGQLTLSARGDLSVGGVVSDGFASGARDAALLGGLSYGLALETDGSATFGLGALVRTGTGDLAVRAGGDLVLADPTAALYTAGSRAAWATGFQNAGATSGAPVGEFPTQGGDLDLTAGGSITAPTTLQTTSAWLFRRGASAWGTDVSTSAVTQQASWSVVYKNFQQGVAALGGGDVRVRAGQDVSQLAVAIPTTGQVTTAVGQATQAGDLVVRGGGDLQVSAGRDLLGGLDLLGRGQADLRAGRNVAAAGKVGLRKASGNSAIRTQLPVGLLLGLGDATATVAAGGGTYLEGVFDPMRQGQIAEALAGGTTGAAWVGYTDRTAVRALAAGGGVTYANDPWASTDLSLSASSPAAWRVDLSGTGTNVLSDYFAHAPPSLELASLSASVALQDHLGGPGTIFLESAPRGLLSLLAVGDVRLGLDVIQEELDPRYQRTWRAAYATTAGAAGNTTAAASKLTGDATINYGKGATPLHAGDPTPDRVVAVQGSVCAQAGGSCQRLPPPLASLRGNLGSLQLPKPLELVAGLDVLAGEYRLQGNSASDLTTVTAGRDVYQPILELFGPGTALVRAGRDVILGEPAVTGAVGPPPLSGGAILSLGNRDLSGSIYSSALPHDQATQVQVMAGVRPGREDAAAFTAAYLDPANATQRAVHDYLPALRSFMTGLDASAKALPEADLVAAFQALPLARRETFLSAVLLTELKEAGIDHNDPKSPRYQSYGRATAALAALYGTEEARSQIPEAERGNILLHGKQVETDANTLPATAGAADLMTAGLTLLAPFGRVEVGTDLLQGSVNPSLGGVVTRRGGDIRILADQNIDLFSSRVFTLQGGDITMWTTRGSITAGVGSKTSVFQRPLAYAMTTSGLVQVDAFGLQTGAGIGVLDALDDAGSRQASRMDLLAPKGEVDAGDAGIRAVGNINIAAAVVVGVENIQATGVATGVPKVDAPNLGVISSAAAVAQAAASEGVGPQASARSAPADLPSIVTVEVIGYEAPAGETEEERRKKKAKPAR